MKKLAYLLIAAVFLASGLFLLKKEKREDSSPTVEEETNIKITELQDKPETKPNMNQEVEVIPESFKLEVPFLPQAPFANWDSLHEDACEEASLIMVYHALKNTELDPTIGEKEINELISYEEDHGYEKSITVRNLATIAKDYYQINLTVKNYSKENVIEDIAKRRFIILPASGKSLNNPNFKNGGPNYHMLALIGYDKTSFISNDPGTRKGQNYRYDFEVINEAVHDWNPTNINQGEKLYLATD